MRNISRHIASTIALIAILCCQSCVQNIAITKFIDKINSEDAQLIDQHLPHEVLIATGERQLVPEMENGVNPIASAIYPTLGGLKAVSSNESIVRVERKNDGAFYLVGVTPGQATVSVSYLDYGRAFPVIVEKTTLTSVTPPKDYRAQARDSILFAYGISPENASRRSITVISTNEGVRAWNDGTNIGIYAAAPGSATVILSAGDHINESFNVTVDNVAVNSIGFETPAEPNAASIESYTFLLSSYAVSLYEPETESESGSVTGARLYATVYPGIPTDFYDKFYGPVSTDTVVRHSDRRFDFHVGVYPLNATDYVCRLDILGVHFVAQYDGEYGREGTLVSVPEALWYKYFTLEENTGSGRFNDYSVTPARPCIISLRASAGGRTSQLDLDFRLDGEEETDR